MAVDLSLIPQNRVAELVSKLSSIDSSISTTHNNLVSVVEKVEKQQKTDIETLKKQINTLNDKIV